MNLVLGRVRASIRVTNANKMWTLGFISTELELLTRDIYIFEACRRYTEYLSENVSIRINSKCRPRCELFYDIEIYIPRF